MKKETENERLRKNPDNVKAWEDEFHTMMANLIAYRDGKKPNHAESVEGGFEKFCPDIQFIRIDALKPQDYPNRIKDNSIYIIFKVNLIDKTVEVHSSGHVNLSRSEGKATNLAAASMKSVVIANGGKWMRKSKYKDAKDFAKKVADLWERTMEIIEGQTEGYPYKQLREDANRVYSKRA